MKMRVADYVSSFLVQKGVDTTFMLSGGGMMHLVDAVGRQAGLRYVCNHHEQASAMAADAYARLRGFGACFVTSGPGATNALTGVVGAWLDSTPVLFLSGQSKVSQTIRHHHLDGLRQFGTFEVDIVPVVQPVTKYAAFLGDPKRVRYELEKCFSIATSGRPGPVWLDIPVDVQGAQVETDTLEGYIAPPPPKAPPAEVFDALLARIRKAERPLLLAGHGVKAARRVDAFRALVERLGVPVVTTPFAVDVLPHAHPLFVGHPSAKGDRAGNFAVQNTDLLVSVGQSFHVLTTGYEIGAFSPKSHKILVEIDPMVVKRQEVKIDDHLACSVEDFIDGLTAALERAGGPTPSGTRWQRYGQMLKAELDVMKEPHKRPETPEGPAINLYDIFDQLNARTGDDDIFVTDAGLSFYLMGQALHPRPKQQVINSGGLGTMGFALPAALGAAMAHPNRRVVAVTGDGSLQTNVHELGTLAAVKPNLKLLIVNNGGYVSIRNTQRNYFGSLYVGSSDETGVRMPDHRKLADAYGLPYRAITASRSLGGSLSDVLAMEGPVFCEIFIPKDNEVIPSVMSRRREDGTMESTALHDMYPFLPKERVQALTFDGWSGGEK